MAETIRSSKILDEFFLGFVILFGSLLVGSILATFTAEVTGLVELAVLVFISGAIGTFLAFGYVLARLQHR